MQTTTKDYVATTCNRCSGKGYIASYSHVKGGQCFSCSGSGKGQPKQIEREMTYGEMLVAMELNGINIMPVENGDDWLASMFIPDEAVIGARLLLEAA